jgi:hypothetical protein
VWLHTFLTRSLGKWQTVSFTLDLFNSGEITSALDGAEPAMAHSAPYSMGPGDYFPAGKMAGAGGADHSPLCSSEIKNDGAASPLPPTFSW